MIRYRCTHCAATMTAHERRAGQSSVCKACLKAHTIPADKSLWLNEAGEPLLQPIGEPERPSTAEPILGPVVPQVPAPADPPPVVIDLGLEPVGAPEVPDLEYLAAHAPTRPEIRLPQPASAAVASSASVSDVPSVRPEAGAGVSVAAVTPPPAAPAPARKRAALVPVVPPAEDLIDQPAPPPPPPPAPVVVARGEPVQIQTQAEIAAAISSALAARMKPPKKARRDLRPSTAAWMLLTAFGVALVIVALVANTATRLPALILGAAQIVIGYVWIVRLTYARHPNRGLLCAVPPITLYYLAQSKYARLRPLRFVGTGAVILALAAAVPALAPHTRFLGGKGEQVVIPPADPAMLSKLEQLRHYRDHRSYDKLSEVLRVLAKTDPERSVDAKDRPQLSAELRELCKHVDMKVRVLAMAAYAKWDPDNARAVVLGALRSERPEEREMALQLLPLWKDAQSARAAAAMIGSPGRESTRAKEALEEIGGPAAEQAAIGLLRDARNLSTRLTALALLEKVGGPDTAVALRAYARACDDQTVKNRAVAVAELIEARERSWLLRNAPVN